jgi:S-adenosylmethionine decarboxylase
LRAVPGNGSVREYEALDTIGSHCLVELYDCPAALLDDETVVRGAVRTAANEGFATLLHEVSHHFHPQGVTALGLIAESHIAIHTWPEHGYAAVDVFTCGDRANAEKACRHIARSLQAGRQSVTKLIRGEGAAGCAASPVPAEVGAG